EKSSQSYIKIHASRGRDPKISHHPQRWLFMCAAYPALTPTDTAMLEQPFWPRRYFKESSCYVISKLARSAVAMYFNNSSYAYPQRQGGNKQWMCLCNPLTDISVHHACDEAK